MMDEKLTSLTSILSKACDAYKEFVKRNLDLLGEVESGIKWISYLAAGRSKDTSPVFSELLYASSNILLLLNDTIVRQATSSDDDIPPTKVLWAFNDEHFRLALTLIEYVEVFIEYSSSRLWGNRGKWLAVTVVQLCKTVVRLILLLKQRVGLLLSPPFTPLTSKQRTIAQKQMKRDEETPAKSADEEKFGGVKMTFTLKRSGRTIRSMSAAPTALGRSWKVPESEVANGAADNPRVVEEKWASTPLEGNKFYAELLHVFRPLTHLLALRLCGFESWKPWLLAMGMDVTSLRLIGESPAVNRVEQRAIRLRSWALLYYLLRSPFFDKHTKVKMAAVLGALAKTIPGARFICNPLIDYLPTWQKVYFYTWNN